MTAIAKKEKIKQLLDRGVEKIYPSKGALKKFLLSGRKIKLYQGFDPSMPNLHLGNYVGLMKLRQFQRLGHRVIFLVGDFTGMIGDPTDKLSSRPKLSRQQVLKNAKSWRQQASRILDFEGANPAKMIFNSRWLDKVGFRELIEITANFTVQQIIQRDFFQKRIKDKKPIFLHEFLYPIAQAIDCVEMGVDLEIGGSDQTFNMLAGRHLMKALKGKEKFVLATKLLIDKQGRKIGKTTGNTIFLNASPTEMFGALMAFPDETIIPGLELLTEAPMKFIKRAQKSLASKKVNPAILKRKMAFEVVKINYGERRARQAQKEFERVFKNKKTPSRIAEVKISESRLPLLELLTKTKLAKSKSEAKRLIVQRAVRIDGQIQEDWRKIIKIKKKAVLRAGKRRFVKIT
jgi:tyrosyl-tRNA synthetase